MVSFNAMLQFLALAHYSIALLDAYGLSRQMDRHGTYSGWIIGIYQLWHGIGTLATWMGVQVRPNLCVASPRMFVAGCLGVHILGAAGYIAVAGRCVPASVDSSMMLAARSLSGLGAGMMVQFNFVSIAKVLPPAGRAEPIAKVFFGATLGVGLGPIMAVLCNLIHKVFGRPATPDDFALVGVAQVAGGAVLLACAACLWPDLSEFIAEKDADEEKAVVVQQDSPTARGQVGAEPSESAASAQSPAPAASAALMRASAPSRSHAEEAGFQERRWVVAGCIVLSLIRGLGASSLEAATSYVLEADYRWPAHSIGIVVSAAFLTIVPVRLIWTWNKERLSVVGWMRLLMLVCLVGVALLPICKSPWWVVVLDAFFFPCIYWCDALGIGVMQRHFLPEGSYFDANHGSLFQGLAANGLGRAIGPALTRSQIDTVGFTLYCVQQCALVGIFYIVLELVVRPNMLRD